MALLHPQHRPCLVIGPTQATYILPHHHQPRPKVEVEDQDYHAMASPPAHVLDLSTLSMWSMFTTTFFGLSGRPVRKDEPEPEADGGDEEVQEEFD